MCDHLERIVKADLVMSNLTHNNSNAMYELVVRHIVAKPIIYISKVSEFSSNWLYNKLKREFNDDSVSLRNESM